MTRITVRVEGHYEVHEAPFSRSYKWHPTSVTLVCGCGQELTSTGGVASTDSTCQCGTDHSALVADALANDVRSQENQLGDAVTHPWNHQIEEQAAQHLRDEAAYPEGSPQRYEDVTSGMVGEDEERWKKARAQQNRASFEGD
ncbi:MAG: hypothetical protein AVDCRST_MAG93-8496 [uncultured Chloroflexia bacterium]|uniref:Uncharacterized protein n=1 Tax=uncultured Chloroflexia bacterium TaxID=1672391 RepID=A0A6J4N0W8_9CHLR|nr:MAG: hypothetical protein AVDCRST_MAG93-8496 [uncultured Chloroflexia bacterium]